MSIVSLLVRLLRGRRPAGPEDAPAAPVAAEATTEEYELKFLVLTVTYACQLRCCQCHMWQHKRTPGELSGEEWLGVLRNGGDLLRGDVSVVVAGGEPLVKPWCIDLLQEIDRLGLRSVLVTNGYAIDEQMAERLAAAGLKEMNISIDGFAELHDRLRGRPGTYERAWRAIELIKRHRPETSINVLSILMAPNLEELPRLIRKVDEDPRINGVVLQALAEPFGAPHDPQWREHNELWPKDLAAVDAAIEELVRMKAEGVQIHWDEAHIRALGAYFHDPSSFVTARCTVGDQTLTVNVDGTATLCGQMAPVGNVRESSISELWRSELTREIRRRTHECQENCHVILNCPFD